MGVQVGPGLADGFLGGFGSFTVPGGERRQLRQAVGRILHGLSAAGGGVEHLADIAGIPALDVGEGESHRASLHLPRDGISLLPRYFERLGVAFLHSAELLRAGVQALGMIAESGQQGGRGGRPGRQPQRHRRRGLPLPAALCTLDPGIRRAVLHRHVFTVTGDRHT